MNIFWFFPAVVVAFIAFQKVIDAPLLERFIITLFMLTVASLTTLMWQKAITEQKTRRVYYETVSILMTVAIAVWLLRA